MKICSKCNIEKDLLYFYNDKHKVDGKKPECKECTKAKCLQYSKSELGKVSRSEYNKIWSKTNSHKKNASTRARQAKKYQAIPKWANLKEVKSFYKLAKELEKQTGIKFEVDHIVPLQSEIVCGLHCESNLRVIPQLENRIKGNLVWPNYPN